MKGPPSSEHAKLEPGSVAVKAKVAEALFDKAGGPETMLVCGGIVSTVHS